MQVDAAMPRRFALAAGLALVLGGLGLHAWNTRLAWRRMPPDAQRVQDVLSLSWRIVLYRHQHGALPARLADLDEDGAWKIPLDPATSAPYAYERLGHGAFRLCADFAAAADPGFGKPGTVHYGDPLVHGYGDWAHGMGGQCIDRQASAR